MDEAWLSTTDEVQIRYIYSKSLVLDFIHCSATKKP